MNGPKIILCGGSGFIGQHLVSYLTEQGFDVVQAVRKNSSPNTKQLFWDPENKITKISDWENCKAIINLCGSTIACRWTPKNLKTIINSRIQPTKFICDIVTQLESPPEVLINTSAIGYYSLENEENDEFSPPGNSTIADICQQWESAVTTFDTTRTCIIRIGQVFGKNGGVLKKLMPIFKAGFGGNVGSGKQWVCWIGLLDLMRMFSHLITSEQSTGAYNAVTPKPVQFRSFAEHLASALHRPCLFPVPSFVLKALYGQMAEELILKGSRIKPQKILAENFVFQNENIGSFLKSLFSKKD